MATCSSILAWKIPWTVKPGRLQSMGSQKSQTQLSEHTHTHTHTRTRTVLLLKLNQWLEVRISASGDTHGWEGETLPGYQSIMYKIPLCTSSFIK